MNSVKATSLNLPFENTYWAIPDRLMAGGYPLADVPRISVRKLSSLIDCGIRHIIDLTEADEINRLRDRDQEYEKLLTQAMESRNVKVVRQHTPVKDFSAPARKQMMTILDAIDDALDQNRPVYVHCWAGIGRTGTVVGCYLARHGYARDTEVLERLQELRGHTDYAFMASPQSREQIEMVLSWVEGE